METAAAPAASRNKRKNNRPRARRPASNKNKSDDGEEDFLLAKQLADLELADAKLAQQLADEDARLAQELADEDHLLLVEEEESNMELMRYLQFQSDADLAMEIQTNMDDVKFAKALQRELGPQSYSSRASASLSHQSSHSTHAGKGDDDDTYMHLPKYTMDSLVSACSRTVYTGGARKSTATLARLRELQAKDVRYNLAYLPEIQRTKQRLELERRNEADEYFLEMNPQVIDIVAGRQESAVAQIDLHYMTVLQAEERVAALFEFLVAKRKPTNRIVLITGKGSIGPSKLGPAMTALCDNRRDLVRNYIRGEGKLEVSLVRLI